MGVGRQLSALLYKDVVIRRIKRHYLIFLFELVLPILFVVMIGIFRRNMGNSESVWHDPRVYDPMGPFQASDIRFSRDEYSGTVVYAPQGAYADSIVNYTFGKFHPPPRGFVNVSDLEMYLANTSAVNLAIVFPENAVEHRLEYTLQFSTYMFLDQKYNTMGVPRTLDYYGGYAPDKKMVWPTMYTMFKAHADHHNWKLTPEDEPVMRPFPSQKYFAPSSHGASPSFFDMFSIFSGALVPMCYLYFLSSFAKNNIAEKESRLREMMKMMGMKDIVYWLNSLLVGLSSGVCICLILTLGMCVGPDAAMRFSDITLIFFTFVVFTIGAILFVMLICTLINSPKAGSLITVLLVLGAWGLNAGVLDRPLGNSLSDYLAKPASIKIASSLLPFIGLHWILKSVMYEEEIGEGLQWSTVAQASIPGDNISPLTILLTMMFSWAIYIVLMWYLDAIVPWQYGMPKEPLFFLKKSYWFGDKEESMRLLSPMARDNGEDFEMVEPVTNAGEPVIRLRHVSHNFGPVQAVSDLSLKLYANQITMLLGHNGAGKTTAMNILTGLFPPTEGDVFINGFNVRTDTRKARSGVGLCPQHNVLFDELTVNEHLHFFATLKGAPRNTIPHEISELLAKLTLSPKAGTLAKDLSGGMKRKLSLANAMVGGSKILILDEPTAGMDPEARRGVWTILQQERQSRTVLMTTHYMEEADVLGDRVAFVAKGHLMCAGSPMFLKRKFETGYKLTLAKSHQNTNVQRALTEVKQALRADEGVSITSNLGYEFCINIGFPDSHLLIELFRRLEKTKAELEIESIGISVTTMEDVFMKVGERESAAPEDTIEDKKDRGEHKMNGDSGPNHSVAMLESATRFDRIQPGFALTMRQMQGLLMKRFHAMRREWKMLWYLMMLPLIFTFAYCVLAASNTESAARSLTYSLRGIYGNTKGFLEGADNEVMKSFGDSLRRDGVDVKTLSNDKINAYLLDIGLNRPDEYKTKWSAGGQIDSQNNTLWFNGEPYHMGAAALARWQEAVIRRFTTKDAVVKVTNRVLATKHDSPPFLDGFIVHLKALIFMSVVVSYLVTAAIMFPVQERVTKTKLVQLMSGVSRLTYVASNFIFDLGIMLVPIICSVLICVIVDPLGGFRAYGDSWVAIFFVLFTYGVSMLPIIYAFSYLFKDSASALSTLQNFAVTPVIIAGITVLVVDLISSFNETKSTYWIKLASFLPGFAATYAFANIHINGQDKAVCDKMEPVQRLQFCLTPVKDLIQPCCHPCPDTGAPVCFQHTSIFSFDARQGILFQVMAMWVVGIAGFVLLVLMETYSQRAVVILELINYQRIRNALSMSGIRRLFTGSNAVNDEEQETEEAEDSDVTTERQLVERAVQDGATFDNALVAHALTKYYGSFRAVNDISFSVHHRECFGLLGVNGAGKSTTFGMLTGDLLLSGGNAYVQRSDLRSNLREFQSYIGYCPQENALIDCMTGREMLALFCALRGVPREKTPEIVSQMIELADLTPHANKLTRTYSGGNKRKLSIAIAMIGNPRLLYLDEPTAGVDPGARRKIWTTLAAAQRDLGSAILLTSHSMEECEALCNRIAIMVGGTLRCLGSSQHLKAKFSQGFTVLVKLAHDSSELEDAVSRCMFRLFSGQCQLKTNHQRLLKFHVKGVKLQWSEVFELILQLRIEPGLAIEDVQVSDTTLEEVFLNFANAKNSSSLDDEVVDGRHTAGPVHI